jgi:hypothetical protein
MVEQLPLSILAPFIKSIDPETHTATVVISDRICKRLEDEEQCFTQNAMPESEPARTAVRLTPVGNVDISSDLSWEEMVARDFDSNQKWQMRVNTAMADSGLIQDRTGWVDEQAVNISIRSSRDDLFSVRVDNCPEGMSPGDLESLLYTNGCDYFTKVVIPHDDMLGTWKRFGFVKFQKLRYALKFVETCPRMTKNGMVLNVGLVV